MKTARVAILFGLATVCCTQMAIAQPEDTETNANSRVDRVLEACNLIADRHADPPVRQQLVLLAAKSMYAAQDKNIPRGLSEKVSQLTTAAEFDSFLKSIASEVGEFAATDVIGDLVTRIPGGGTLTDGQEAKVQATVTANQYVGVGIALKMEGRPVITTSFYGGPGYKAGVKNDDMIMAIDGDSTEGKSLGEVVKHLRGAAGTDVKLQLKHPTAGEREIVVTRNVTFIPTVHGASQTAEGKWNYRLPKHPDVALFRIDRFGASTANELRKLERELSDSPLNGIVLDLRGGGGALHDIVMVANQFLEAGVIGSTKIGDKEATYESEDGCHFEGVPMVVLTARSSSASSVFLAAALQDRGRAVVVGQATNGMSYIRSQLDLSNGDKLVIPTGYVHRVNGTVLFTRQTAFEALMPREFVPPEKLDLKSANRVVPDHPVPANVPVEGVIKVAVKVLKELAND